MFGKLKGVWSAKNEEESGRRSSETEVHRPDYTGLCAVVKGQNFILRETWTNA